MYSYRLINAESGLICSSPLFPECGWDTQDEAIEAAIEAFEDQQKRYEKGSATFVKCTGFEVYDIGDDFNKRINSMLEDWEDAELRRFSESMPKMRDYWKRDLRRNLPRKTTAREIDLQVEALERRAYAAFSEDMPRRRRKKELELRASL